MTDFSWDAVDDYLTGNLIPQDASLVRALNNNAAAGLPAIDVAPNQGKFLQLIASICGARSVLEIGTLGGYSTIWLARGIPHDGRVTTLEVDPVHAEIARRNLDQAGVGDKVTIRVGAALDTLTAMGDEGAGPFDLVFIDADKPNNPGYLDWAVRLTRPGSVIIGDNVVRAGAVLDADSTDDRVVGTRSFLEKLAAIPTLDATALQTVGAKGWDGFAMAVVRAVDDESAVSSAR